MKLFGSQRAHPDRLERIWVLIVTMIMVMMVVIMCMIVAMVAAGFEVGIVQR